MAIRTDVLVIGSGIAGLFYALRVADHRKVLLVTKKHTVESNTNYAQGGIASVFGSDDSFELHIQDTIDAGAGLCHRDTVDAVITEGPALIRELMHIGTHFTERQGDFDLGREGGHSRNRIVHAKDLTGREIERALVARAIDHPNVTVLENHVAIDLITEHNLRDAGATGGIHCWGAYVLGKEQGMVHTILADTTVLSTGGCGCVYLHTTNPAIATGDGIAMAYRAGAVIANMEFLQFHPTTLYHPDARSFLISEAVRGRGAILVNGKGERFMEQYDARKELAPRDIVARAIDAELKRSGDSCIYLDLRHLDAADIRQSFPTIDATCRSLNIDITRDLVPVVPAAHYMCGGVVSDLHGRSNIHGLYTCGEVSMTGLHGANRLASNSLLEALVLANRAAAATLAERNELPNLEEIRDWDDSGTFNMEEWVLISHNRHEVQSLMWDYVGIVRSDLRLQRAARRIQLVQDEVENFYKRTKVSEDLIELRNITLVARLIIDCAMRRKESRGLHYTTDYPSSDPSLAQTDTIITRPF
jgi:L-aspartate oxidase